MGKAYEHQLAWSELVKKRRQVELLEGRVRELVRELEKGRGELEVLIADGKDGLESMERSERCKFDPIPDVCLDGLRPSSPSEEWMGWEGEMR